MIRILGVASACVLGVCAMGCFGPLPTGDGEPPAGQGLVDSVDGVPDSDRDGEFIDASPDEMLEPPVEEPIRPVDSTEDLQEVFTDTSGDLNADGALDDGDVDMFINQFGTATGEGGSSPADLDGDGDVTLVDFQMFLSLLSQETP